MKEISEKSKEHRRAYMREYRQNNLERVQAANRAYYWANREKMLEYGRKYREQQKANMTERDLEERRAYQRVMYQVYKERRKEQRILGCR